MLGVSYSLIELEAKIETYPAFENFEQCFRKLYILWGSKKILKFLKWIHDWDFEEMLPFDILIN